MTPKFKLGRDFRTVHLSGKFRHPMFTRRKLSCWQTNKQTPLKTPNAHRCATTLGNKWFIIGVQYCVGFVWSRSRWRRSLRPRCRVTRPCDCRPMTRVQSAPEVHRGRRCSRPVLQRVVRLFRLDRLSLTWSRCRPTGSTRRWETRSVRPSSRSPHRRCHCAMPTSFCRDSLPKSFPMSATWKLYDDLRCGRRKIETAGCQKSQPRLWRHSWRFPLRVFRQLTSYSPVTREPPTNFPMERLPPVYGCITYLLADFCGNRWWTLSYQTHPLSTRAFEPGAFRPPAGDPWAAQTRSIGRRLVVSRLISQWNASSVAVIPAYRRFDSTTSCEDFDQHLQYTMWYVTCTQNW